MTKLKNDTIFVLSKQLTKKENKLMKKIFILMVFAIMFIACSDNSVSPEPTYTQPAQQPTYSQSSQPVTYSSTSTYIQPTNTQPYITSNSSDSNSSETVSYWSLEVGNVCNGYNIDVAINDKSKPVESYYAMYQICGDRANLTYMCEPIEQSVEHIMELVNKQTALQIVDLAKNYGAAFGFYNAVDGYLRYVYFEQCYDNKALMKRQ